jgi:hypothetical protein
LETARTRPRKAPGLLSLLTIAIVELTLGARL